MKLKYRLIHKIIIGCLVLILLPLSIMAYRLYYKSDVYVEEQLVRQLETRLEDFNNFYLNEINGNILLFFNIWHQSPDFDQIFNNPKGMEGFRKEWQAALKGYPEVLSVYYADSSGNFLNYPDFEVSSDYDPTQRQWYRDAYENPKQVQWSEPYMDYMTEEIIVTVSQAQINPSGEIIGVFAIDLIVR